MNALILTLGTRGDLELFLLLARSLQARGHNVQIVTSHFHAPRALAAGVPCVPVGDARPAQLDDLLASLASIPDLRTRTRAYVERFIRPQLALAAPVLESLAAGSDYFISNLKITITKNGPILPTAFVTYDPPATVEELDRYSATLPRERILELVAFPKTFIDPSATWPDRFHFTGFWADTAPAPELPIALAKFISPGAPPIVFTLGSMRMFDRAYLVATFAAALHRSGRRGILLGIPPSNRFTRHDLFFADEVPYSALFPHVACISHHGGVGTVTQALLAGKPSIVFPQILAQRHMADLLERHKLSAGTFDPAAVAEDSLAASITSTVTEPHYTVAAEAWRDAIKKDPGISAAATAIERHWSTISAT